MSKEQLEHFARILQNWKRDLMVEVDRTVLHMKDEAANFPDPNDRATQEEEFSLELRTRDRERKLIRKIDEALKRIEDGSYGYCLETGEEIGIKRLKRDPSQRSRWRRRSGASAAKSSTATATTGTAEGGPRAGYVGPTSPLRHRRSAPGVAVCRGGELSRRARPRRALAVAHRGRRSAARSPGSAAAILRTLEAFGFEWDGEVVRQRERPGTMRPPLDSLACPRSDLRVLVQPPQLAEEDVIPAIAAAAAVAGVATATRLRVDPGTSQFVDRIQGTTGKTWQPRSAT